MKTIKKFYMELFEVDQIPEKEFMEFNKFYYSKTFEISSHLCPLLIK